MSTKPKQKEENTITLWQVFTASGILQRLANFDQPIAQSYDMAQLLNQMLPDYNFVIEKRDIKMRELGIEGKDWSDIDADTRQALASYMQQVAGVSCKKEYEKITINVSDIDKAARITPQELMTLTPFVDFVR